MIKLSKQVSNFTSEIKLNAKRKKRHKNKHNGFTIVELIVVMAIIAILTLIAVPTFTKYIDKAEDTTEASNAKTLYTVALTTLTDEIINPSGDTYNTPGFDSSNNGLDHNSELYKSIESVANIPLENNQALEVYTVKTGNELNDFNYENVDLETYSDQFVNEWSVILPIDGEKNASLDADGSIYVIPPAFIQERYVYKDGSPVTKDGKKVRLFEYSVKKDNNGEYDN